MPPSGYGTRHSNRYYQQTPTELGTQQSRPLSVVEQYKDLVIEHQDEMASFVVSRWQQINLPLLENVDADTVA